MHGSKQHVDKHVANILGRIKDAKERNGRGYQIAKLYVDVQEYEVAKRYVSGFLTVRENFAAGHKLHGQILEHLGQTDDAITAYKRSLDIDDRQKDIVVKVCELYLKEGRNAEVLKYWSERADKLSPGNPVVFKIREKIANLQNEGESSEDLESLITAELVKRPKDADLRAKLLRLYLDTGRINESYTHAVDVENRYAYPDSISWCHVVLEVFERYQRESGGINGSFHQNLLTVQARLVQLTLNLDKDRVVDAAEALYNFDQILHKMVSAPVSGPSWEILYREMQARYYSYAGHLLLKRAQQGHLPWVEANNMAAICYLISFSVTPPNMTSPWVVKATEQDKKRYNNWHEGACYRASQAGHLLMSLADGEGQRWANKVHAQWAIAQGRDKIFDHMFTLRHMKGTKDTSFLINNGLHTSFKVSMPTDITLRDLDKVAHLRHGEDLRSLVWLALHQHEATDKKQPDYGFTVYNSIQYESSSMDLASPESLSRLDTEAFFYAVVHTTVQWLSERRRALQTSETQIRLLPLCLGEVLCTAEQAEWWKAIYTLSNNLATKELGKLRLVLQRGIETVRLIGNHGVPVALVMHMARVFTQRVEDAKTTSAEVQTCFLRDRAAMYWNGAVDMLQRLENNQNLWSPKQRLFINQGPLLSKEEIKAGLEEGRLFLAVYDIEMGHNEKALEGLNKLASAEASHHQASIYLSMADDLGHNDSDREEALYYKARDALYETMDRIQGHRHHNLTHQLPAEIDRVEARLNRLKCSIAEAPTYADETDAVGDPSESVMRLAGLSYNTSTPQRPSSNRPTPTFNRSMNGDINLISTSPHVAPSPERLDAQVRSVNMTQDLIMQQLKEMKDEMEQQKKLFREALTKNTQEMEKLKDKIEKLGEQQATPVPPPPAPAPAPAPITVQPAIPQMPPGMDRGFRPAVPPPPPAAYYSPYRPEYDYPAPPPHPGLAPYSPHPHGYPIYAPPFPTYPYAAAAAAAAAGPPPPPPTQPGVPPPIAATLPPPPPPQPPQTMPPVTSQSRQTQEEEEDYYVYDDEEYPGEEEEVVPGLSAGRGRDQPGMVPGPGGTFHIPDSQLVQDWPYGNSVNMEGKATLTYSPSHPPMPQPGYFSQIPPAAPRSQPIPGAAQGMYGSPLAPAATIGPGFFSSPERPVAFAQRFQSPTHLAVQGGQAVSQLTAPKPGFLPTSTANKTDPPKMPPPNASLTVSGEVISPAPPRTSSGPTSMSGAAVSASTPQTPTTTISDGSDASTFGTKFPISLPMGTSGEAKLPTLVPDTSPFTICSKQEDEEEDNEVADDSYTGPEFEPIVPLPAEVEVVTGEEDEKVLFSARCKLFRFIERQWKERGIGEIKILQHEDSGKARIVMRREQVHKVCANFSLSAEMTIDYKSTSEKKILSWSAMDFAEGQSQVEQFCARFKTEDIALDFKNKFEEAVKFVKENKKKASTAKKEVKKPAEGKASLLEKFRPKAGSWTCDTCMINNTAEAKKCVACETPRPGVKQDPVENKPTESTSKITFGSGGGFNFGAGSAMSSFSFGSPNTTATSTAPKASTGGFGFGSATTTPSTAVKPADANPVSSFGFGSAGGEFKFGGPGGTTAAPTTPASSIQFTPAPPTTNTSSSMSSPFAFGSKPTSESAVSSSTDTPDAASKATAVLSPPKFSFIPKTGADKDEKAATSTTSTPGASPFAFGSGTPVSFGTPTTKPTATSTTPASDMLKSFATQAKPTDVPKPQATANTLGGFTFTSTPVVQKKEEEKPKEAPVVEEAKSSPFAGFSFAQSGKTDAPPTFGSIASKPSFTSTAVPQVAKTDIPTNMGTFGSKTTAAEISFSSLADTTEGKPEAFSQKSNFKGFPGAGAPIFGAGGGASPSKGPDDGTGAEDEYEPNVDFQPVIPLPALVDVKTGEEDEIKLFSERAKLYRHDPDTKQWKERGIGDMKILQHRQTNRCRLLMRREQVHKICCNQQITPEMKIQPMATSEKAWCWIGQDFSEGEVKVEQFACKFKNTDLAQKFKDAFDEAQKIKPIEPEKPKAAAPAKTGGKSDGVKPLSSLFKVKEGSWKCDACLITNKPDVIRCVACQTPKPGAEAEAASQSAEISSSTVSGSGFSDFKFGSTSSGFGFGSSDSSGGKNDNTPASTFSFKGGFTFGKAPDKDATSEADSEPKHAFSFTPTKQGGESRVSSSTSPGFVFGKDVSTPGFTFSGVTPSKPLDLSATRSPRSPSGDDLYENVEGDDSHIYFEPVVHLEKVDVKTGEEDEDVIYGHRAKLFRFTNNEWKERGLGDVKILCHKESKKYRIIMRREQVHKLCLNHYLSPELDLQPMKNANGKAWVWHADDYVDGQVEHEQLAIKFKNKEIADDFKKAFDDSKEEKAKPTATKSAEPDSTSDKPTKPDTTAKKDEQKGLFGSSSSTSSGPGSFSFKPPGSTESTPKSDFTFGSGGSFTFGKTGTSVFGGSPTSTKEAEALAKSPGVKGESLLAKMLAEDDVIFVKERKATPEQVEKARELKLPDNFYLYEEYPPCKGCLGCDDGEGKMIKAKSGVKPSSVSTPVQPQSQPDLVLSTTPSADVPMFGGKSTASSFSSLAAASGNSFSFGKKDSDKPFSWSGTGSSLFRSPGGGGAGGDEGEDGEVVPSDDIHFEPIVSLPEVEVKTGEEDENVLYSHRAKLFRFDNQLKQWKERGVGDIKLLQHRETGKIRVLMRREQVLKLAANHMLSPEMQLTPLQTSETAWCWFALDIAEGTPRHEHLAIKFKTKEIAENFKVRFMECQELLKSLPQSTGIESPVKPDSTEDSFVTVEGDRSDLSALQYEDDDEEDDEVDEEEILFNKRATLTCAVGQNTWKTLALGDLMIVYDDDVMGFRIRMFNEKNEAEYVCNHIICQEYQVLANETKKFCEWTAKDFATDEPVTQTFQALFSSKAAVQDFRSNFNKGVELARENELSERTECSVFLPTREITVPEVVGTITEN